MQTAGSHPQKCWLNRLGMYISNQVSGDAGDAGDAGPAVFPMKTTGLEQHLLTVIGELHTLYYVCAHVLLVYCEIALFCNPG